MKATQHWWLLPRPVSIAIICWLALVSISYHIISIEAPIPWSGRGHSIILRGVTGTKSTGNLIITVNGHSVTKLVKMFPWRFPPNSTGDNNYGNLNLPNNSPSLHPGYISILNFILNYYPKIDLEVRDIRGFTALIKAAMQGRVDCVSSLLMAGKWL